MIPQTKRCSQCGKTKPISEFYRNASRSDGHASACKICERRQHDRTRANRQARQREERARQSRECNAETRARIDAAIRERQRMCV